MGTIVPRNSQHFLFDRPQLEGLDAKSFAPRALCEALSRRRERHALAGAVVSRSTRKARE
jgi:hypothetical protein